ncbi:MAG: hypothetical protein MJH10_09560 [Epibacterium sp.]|nr:hypothetical protein [Epibacterium sp.]
MTRLLEQSVINGRVSEELANFAIMMVRGYINRFQAHQPPEDREEFEAIMLHHFCEHYQYFAQQPAPASLWGKRISARWSNHQRDKNIRDRLFQQYGERELRRGGLHRVG